MMPHTDPNIGEKIQRKLNWLLAFNGVLAVALIVAVVYYAGQAAQAHDALCNLRTEQVRRLVGSQDFVNKHPHGAFGFTKAQIDQQIANSKKTIAALDDLGCDAVPLDVAVDRPQG